MSTHNNPAVRKLVAAAVLQARGDDRAAALFIRASRDPSLAAAAGALRRPVLSAMSDWPLSRGSRRGLTASAQWPFSQVRAGLDTDFDAMGLGGDDVGDDLVADALDDDFDVESAADEYDFDVEVVSAADEYDFDVEVESAADEYDFDVEVVSGTEDEDEGGEDEGPDDGEETARFKRALANLQRRDALQAAKKKKPVAKKPARR